MKKITNELRQEKGYIPEIYDNFEIQNKDIDGLNVVSYYDNADKGRYNINIEIKALNDIDKIFVFVSRKHLVYMGSLKKGEKLELSKNVVLMEIIPRFYKEAYNDNIAVSIACTDTNMIDVDINYTKIEKPVLFLAGDSTVADEPSNIPYNSGECFSSWGQNISAFLQDIIVNNQAHNGLTTETFRSEGHYNLILNNIKPGDYCAFQFGHNDQKQPHLQYDTGYRANLIQYVSEIRSLGAIPILITPLARNTWSNEYYDLLIDYKNAVMQIGKELNVDVIDLHGMSVEFIKEKGRKESTGYFHLDDMTHSNDYGSYKFAKFVVEGLKNILPKVYFTEYNFDFEPPKNLWSTLTNSNTEVDSVEEKEQFHKMEMSIDSLLKRIEEAKNHKE